MILFISSSSDALNNKIKYDINTESRRVRKKREWLAKQNKSLDKTEKIKQRKYKGDWANLPDLILEEIFQYLPYKVRNNSCHIASLKMQIQFLKITKLDIDID